MSLINSRQIQQPIGLTGSFSGSFYGDGAGIFSGSFSGSISSTLQEVTDNGSTTTNTISASRLDTNALNVLGDTNITGSLIISSSEALRNIGQAQFTGSVSITGSLDVNGVDYILISASFDTRITENSSSIYSLSQSFTNTSSSVSIRLADLESFSSSLDTIYATDAELNVATSSLSESIAYLSSSYLLDSSSFSSSISLLSSSFDSFSGSYNTGSFTGSFTGSLLGTASWAENALTASYVENAQTASFVLNAISSSYSLTASYIENAQTASYVLNAISSSYSATASYLNTLNQDLTFNGNLTLNGTASITYLDVTYESASIIYSSGSNQLGDATNDIQTLVGTVKVSGSLQITGSANIPHLTGSLQGTASYSNQTLSSSYALTASYVENAQTASYVLQAISSSFASTASYVLNAISSSHAQTASYAFNAVSSSHAVTASGILGGKAPHVPYFITDTTLATSSIYQSGSTSVIINQDANTTANPEALYVWQPSTSSFNVISGKGNLNNYLQLNIQNTNQGVDSSSDVVATANNGNETQNYIDMGINSENYTGPLGGVNDAYLYSTGEHLHIGNASNRYVAFFAGGDDVDTNNKLRLDPSNYHEMTGSLDISDSLIVQGSITGSLLGTASYADNALSSSYASYTSNADLLDGKDSTIFATTGSNKFIGNQTVTGSLFTTGSNTLVGTTTLTGSLNISGSTLQVGNNTLLGNTVLSGSILVSGSLAPGNLSASVNIYGDTAMTGFLRFNPHSTNIDTTISASYIFVSGSTNDLYFSQNGEGYSNTTRLRWIEGNLYTGLLNGGVITSQSSTVYQVSSGSGVVVNLNASLNTNPYPTIQYVNWSNISASINSLTASYDQQFVAVQSDGTIFAQGTPFTDGQYNSLIPIGIVIHQNRSTINATQTFPSVGYGWKQRSFDFIKAFGPLKISGYTLSPSGSSTGSLVLSGGVAWVDGRNYTVDPNNPSYINEVTGIVTSKIYRYRQSGSGWAYDTNGGTGYTAVDPTNYSNNGVLTPVGTNDWTIQRVFYFPNSATKAFYIYYGNASYANQSAAQAAVNTEPFSEAPNTIANAIYVGYMLLRHNADFTVPASYAFYGSGLFRGSGASVTSGGGGSTALVGLSDVSITSPTNGQPLVYNSSILKWQNQSTLTASLNGNASTATSASHASTASYSQTAVSSSYALTASYALNGGGGSGAGFPYTGSAIITGSLVVTGSVESTLGFTGSLFGTASWSQNSITASYVLNAISSSHATTSSYASTASFLLGSVTSASYAATSSYANDFTIGDKLYQDGTLTHRSTVLSTIVGTNNLYTQATGSYTAAFGKYTIYNGANARAGEFMTVWNGTTVSYTDTSTTDIGDTSTIVFSSAIVGSGIEINAVAGASGWRIKILTTFI